MTSAWLNRALEESRARGHLGPGDLQAQIAHALGFAASWDVHRPAPPASFLDLGSGGGLPGLVLLDLWGIPGTLLDSMHKRTEFLIEALDWPDAPPNSTVITGRAEEYCREASLEGAFDLVTSRSFGPPATTAECAVRFLTIGGLLVVSEPPQPVDPARWPRGALSELGLQSMGAPALEVSFHVLQKVSPTPEGFPRKVGVPGKRPLF